jgi:hypothetical protein
MDFPGFYLRLTHYEFYFFSGSIRIFKVRIFDILSKFLVCTLQQIFAALQIFYCIYVNC